MCVSLKKKAIKNDFQINMKNVKGNSKPFYDLIKPYLTNKGALSSNDIVILENNTFIYNDREIADIFNDYYINVIDYTQHTVSDNITDITSETNTDATIDNIIDMYKDHPSIQRINIMSSEANTFSFRPVSEEEVILKLKSIY